VPGTASRAVHNNFYAASIAPVTRAGQPDLERSGARPLATPPASP